MAYQLRLNTYRKEENLSWRFIMLPKRIFLILYASLFIAFPVLSNEDLDINVENDPVDEVVSSFFDNWNTENQKGRKQEISDNNVIDDVEYDPVWKVVNNFLWVCTWLVCPL